MEKNLETKLALFKKSQLMKDYDKLSIDKECKRLEEKLKIPKIQRKELLFLKLLGDKTALGQEVNLSEIARQSGYKKSDASSPVPSIIKNIDPRLFSEVVGFGRSDIEFQLARIIRQDKDLTAKMRALELAAKIMGLNEDKPSVAIQINSGLQVAD